MMDKNNVFPFRNVSKEEIPSPIKTLSPKNATLFNDISTKVIFFLMTSIVA